MHVIICALPESRRERPVLYFKPWRDVGLGDNGRPALPLPGQASSPFWFDERGVCKTYRLEFEPDGSAWLPTLLGGHLVAKGLVRRGSQPDPNPSWNNVNAGAASMADPHNKGAHGAAADPYARWCREATTDELVAEAAA
jgi:hypothetical protein